ncbi:MAG: serine/threonine protein kinase [Bacteroidia bacterium]|nr:serine/threonine protein kinase [Bacteroidia bacterium]
MEVGNYQIIRPLAEGGMGTVWLAQHTLLGYPVVIKSLHPQYVQREDLRQRFFTEARLLAQLQHPSIVRLYDFTIQDGVPYIIMEYVEGKSLDTLLARKRGLPLKATQRLLLPVLAALSYLHERNIVHRDIKPSNIMVLPSGEGKLIDFGIAKSLQEDLRLTQTGFQIGTALYMAPEQIQGLSVSPRTDLYAIGLIAYECLFGKYPWEWEGLTAFQLYQRLLSDPPSFPEWAPPSWKSFFQQALAKKPEERFPSSEEMQKALSTLEESTEQVAFIHPTLTPPTLTALPLPSPPPSPPRKKKKWLFFLVAALLLLPIIGITFRYGFFSTKEEPAVSPPPGASTPPMQKNHHSRRLRKDYSPQIQKALYAKLLAYAEEQNAIDSNTSLVWDTLPQKNYPIRGELEVAFRRNFRKEVQEMEEAIYPCYVSNIPLGPPRGVQTVKNYYAVIYLCEQRGKVSIQYTYDPLKGDIELFLSSFPPPDEDTVCTQTSRELLRQEEGTCE